jgi:hemoglobin
MEYKVTPTIQNEKVDFTNPSPDFLRKLGGVEGMRDLMDRFYDKVIESDIANFFPQDPEEFAEVKRKNTDFFVEIVGGPKIYKEADGVELNEYMIHVHDEFSIPEKARLEWLGCMEETLKETDIPDSAKESFWDYVEKFSKLTVNSFPERENFF